VLPVLIAGEPAIQIVDAHSGADREVPEDKIVADVCSDVDLVRVGVPIDATQRRRKIADSCA
jgi:hypothetical protein